MASSQETTDSEPSGHEARVKLLASRTQQQARVLNPGASPLRSTPVLKAAAPEQPRSVRQAVSEDSAAAMLFEDF